MIDSFGISSLQTTLLLVNFLGLSYGNLSLENISSCSSHNSDGSLTAFAHNVTRNEGVGDLDI